MNTRGSLNGQWTGVDLRYLPVHFISISCLFINIYLLEKIIFCLFVTHIKWWMCHLLNEPISTVILARKVSYLCGNTRINQSISSWKYTHIDISIFFNWFFLRLQCPVQTCPFLNISQRSTDIKKRSGVQLSERLASPGIMGDQLWTILTSFRPS